MTKRIKRYKALKEKMCSIDNELEEVIWGSMRELYEHRNLKEIKRFQEGIRKEIHTLSLIKTTIVELCLPTHLKIDNGWQDVQDFCKDNDFDLETESKSVAEEYVAMFLTDNYNHDVNEFVWVVKGADLWVSRIKWNDGQIIREDIKDIWKHKKRSVENCWVKIMGVDDGIIIRFKEESEIEKCFSINETINLLESHYLM